MWCSFVCCKTAWSDSSHHYVLSKVARPVVHSSTYMCRPDGLLGMATHRILHKTEPGKLKMELTDKKGTNTGEISFVLQASGGRFAQQSGTGTGGNTSSRSGAGAGAGAAALGAGNGFI